MTSTRRITFGIALSLMALAVNAADPKEWEIDGRPLPAPLLPPPRLDEALPDYRPCPAREIDARPQGTAPTILPKLVDRWLAAFRALHPKSGIAVPPPYLPPQGALSPPLQRFLEGKLDFAFVSRDLSATDVATFRRFHGYEPLSIPIAGGSFAHFGFVDAVAIVVHKDNPIERLDFVQLDALLSRTRHRGGEPAKTWGDLGVSQWSQHPVRIVGAGAWVGEESARAITIRERILDRDGKRGEWRRDLDGKDDAEAQVPGKVAADRYAIGFTGMGHLQPGIKAVALAESPSGPWYGASHENVAQATYPLSRVVNLVIAKAPGKTLDPTLDAFVRFLLSRSGQAIVRKQGVLLPLRAAQVEKSLALLGPDSCPAGRQGS